MASFYNNESVIQVVFVTLILGGGCALLAGRAIAATWRNMIVAVLAAFPLAAAVRFVHFALFNEKLLAPKSYLLEAAILLVVICLSFQRTRAAQMVRQYYWLYEPHGFLGWRLRQDAPARRINT
ncbi:MAG: hypothetical protein EKK40_10880 [Bradyrhizobiaceae bacterium]|nr:MAG: hypothetical protein EKK40_10880 [Bradyrhizobiaceae bacterium]